MVSDLDAAKRESSALRGSFHSSMLSSLTRSLSQLSGPHPLASSDGNSNAVSIATSSEDEILRDMQGSRAIAKVG